MMCYYIRLLRLIEERITIGYYGGWVEKIRSLRACYKDLEIGVIPLRCETTNKIEGFRVRLLRGEVEDVCLWRQM
jgi:hypothetical protein